MFVRFSATNRQENPLMARSCKRPNRQLSFRETNPAKTNPRAAPSVVVLKRRRGSFVHKKLKKKKTKRPTRRHKRSTFKNTCNIFCTFRERERECARITHTRCCTYDRIHLVQVHIRLCNCFYVVMYKVIFIKLQYNYMQTLLKIVLHRSQSREHLHVSLFLHS